MVCPSCSKAAPEGSIVCPFCATRLDEAPTSVDVAADPAEAPTSLDPAADLSEAATFVDPAGDPSEAATSMDPGAVLTDAATSAEPQAEPSSPKPATPPPAAPPPVSQPSVSMSDSGQHGRFLPGTMVAERYRIVGLLGRGGMGEVYRADDVKLGQQVALKFLPSQFSADAEHVGRLFDEVRMARKVSHPNVCRVFDVGEADGAQYVSMEYVDGEDLAGLLRRIGRLPKDKAVDIARQLCAALAAAHDEDVLHRDLKPANIMLDGRGRVKLTDFGLAAVAEVRAGTPIYMAPEQLAGDEVSEKSDIYALGLVLHELFTGKRVYDAEDLDSLTKQHQSSLTTSLTSTSELDPAVDAVIHRCLEKSPADRPNSALIVAAGLPGADPLAAALAAGETPSPEMVAEAGGEGSLPLAIAAPLLLASIICVIAVGVVQSRVSLTGWVPFDTPPLIMEQRAHEIVEQLGYSTDYADAASDFTSDLRYILWLTTENAGAERWEAVSGGRPPSIGYWWRSSPSAMIPISETGPSASVGVSLDSPARDVPGMISLRTDTAGRLLWFDVVPERVPDEDEPMGTVDWAGMFDLMGFEMADFSSVEPRLIPDRFADERAAWVGAYAEDPEVSVHIEAAALRGRIVSVRLFSSYAPLQPAPRPAGSSSGGSSLPIIILTIVIIVGFLLALVVAVFGALYVAQRNVRSGRGDLRGARRLGFAVALALTLSWFLGEHTFSGNDFDAFFEMVIWVAAAGGMTWALYVAVEPFMRRHAPEALIGWTRFVDGRFADPLVGRDILIGCALGAGTRLLSVTGIAVSGRGLATVNYIGLPEESVPDLLETFLFGAVSYVALALGLFFLYGLTYVALRRRAWLAFAVWLFFYGGLGFLPGVTVNNTRPAATLATSIVWAIGWAIWLLVLYRYGILMFATMGTVYMLLEFGLPSLDFSAWYSSSMTGTLVIFLGLAGYAFYRTVAWKGGIAEALVGD